MIYLLLYWSFELYKKDNFICLKTSQFDSDNSKSIKDPSIMLLVTFVAIGSSNVLSWGQTTGILNRK